MNELKGIFFHQNTKKQKLRGKIIDKVDVIC